MPLPHWLGRSHRLVANRLMIPLAARMPWFGVLEHVGRRTGRPRRTPVNVFARNGRYIIPMAYGPRSGWVHNVVAAGGCVLVTGGRRVELGEPRRVHDPRRRDVPWPMRVGLWLVNVSDFVELRRAAAPRPEPAQSSSADT